MRVVVIGMGVQGVKRSRVAGSDCIATVDPVVPEADFKHIADAPLHQFDAALVCTSDAAKPDILTYLIENKKHVLVEKPLLFGGNDLHVLKAAARDKNVVCYTAYNHRFEPHFVRMRETIKSGFLGDLYSIRLFYGNGTARLVRDSAWRDQGSGVLTDLGSHLLDTILFWTGTPSTPFECVVANHFENRAPDHCIIASKGTPFIELEMTLLSWRNHFTATVIGSKGMATISSLCKWGPSEFVLRDRKLPSGRPDERAEILSQPDPTWALEYDHFKSLCRNPDTNLDNDIWIEATLNALARSVGHPHQGDPA